MKNVIAKRRTNIFRRPGGKIRIDNRRFLYKGRPGGVDFSLRLCLTKIVQESRHFCIIPGIDFCFGDGKCFCSGCLRILKDGKLFFFFPEDDSQSDDYVPQTPEARIVSGGMDKLPEAQRQQILGVVRAMFANNPDLFKDGE